MCVVVLLVFSLCSLFAQGIEEIADESNLSILNPDFEGRTTAKIRLANGFEAYLISDPQADQSAAALAVGVGAWSDPDTYPGMAHFCEHMLFGGSKKYPQEGLFDRTVSDYSGQTNAYTAPDRTVYFFSSNHSGFLLILDQFAQFFSAPLFDPSRIARELFAVDQEFGKNIENDDWRTYMVLKETGNPNHPNAKFSTGSADTLKGIPQTALKEWMLKHYSADRMRLVLYSSLPMETLKKTTYELFSPIVSFESEGIKWQPLFSESQKGHFLSVVPIGEKQRLSLIWEVPREFCLDPSKPPELLAAVLERGQAYSLYEQLKKEGLADQVQVSVDSMGGREHLLFQIDLELTDKGLEKRDLAILRCFQALARVNREGVPEVLFHEKNRVAEWIVQYQERTDAFSTAFQIGGTLLNESLSSYPREQVLISEYAPDSMSQLLSQLTPDSCLYIIQADPLKSGIQPDQTERWMGVEYAIREIPEQWMAVWSKVTPHEEIHLPGPNLYLPQKLNLIATCEQKEPVKIGENEGGIAYYNRCSEYLIPEVSYSLHVKSPRLLANAESFCLVNLVVLALEDQLHSTLAEATAAGLLGSIQAQPTLFNVSVSGFSEQAALLLKKEMEALLHPVAPSFDQFERYRASLQRTLMDRQKEIALLQAQELMESLIDPDEIPTKKLLSTLQEISYEQLVHFQQTLFEEIYLEGFFAGNVSEEDAKILWDELSTSVNPYRKEQHHRKKILALSEKEGPFIVREKNDALGNGVILLIDQGRYTPVQRAAQEVLSTALAPSFYDALRTKQKTGYIVYSSCSELEQRLFQTFMVQSNSHSPEELLHRFELFLEDRLQTLREEISEGRFGLIKQNRLEVLKAKRRNLKEKSLLFDHLAFERDADFQWIPKRIQGYEELSYETFLREAESSLSRTNRKRLAILMEGRVNQPFVYESLSSADFELKSTYLSRSEMAAY